MDNSQQMIITILAITVPIIVTLLFGFISAWRKDFSSSDVPILNRMVISYAVPMSIFAGTITTTRKYLTENISIIFLILAGVIIMYVLAYFLWRHILKRSLSESALVAMVASAPAVPFFGPAILDGFFGASTAAIPIAVGSIVINVTVVPFTIFLLTIGRRQQKIAASLVNLNGNQTVNNESPTKILIDHLKETVQKPLVWAPLLAGILVALGINNYIPPLVSKSLGLLGQTSAGVALFASGIMLTAYKINFNFFTWGVVFLKNLAAPVLVICLALLFGVEKSDLLQSAITMSIPAMPIIVSFAIEFKTCEDSMPSILLWSTLLSPLTVGLFMAFG